MPTTNYDAAQVWTYWYNKLTAEAGSGRLPTVVAVTKSAHLWKQNVPAVGVQLIRVIESDSSTKTHNADFHFWVAVATRSVESINGTVVTPANLDDAMAQCQAIVGDGTGNGLDAILRDPSNFTSGSNVLRTKIDSVEYDWLIENGEPPRIWAYARVEFHTEAKVSIT